MQVFNGISAVVIATVNFFTLYILLKILSVHRVYRVNLALSDLLSGIIIFPTSIYVMEQYAFETFWPDPNHNLEANAKLFFTSWHNTTEINVTSLLTHNVVEKPNLMF